MNTNRVDGEEMKEMVQKVSSKVDSSLKWFKEGFTKNGNRIKRKWNSRLGYQAVSLNSLPSEGRFYFEVKIHECVDEWISIGIVP